MQNHVCIFWQLWESVYWEFARTAKTTVIGDEGNVGRNLSLSLCKDRLLVHSWLTTGGREGLRAHMQPEGIPAIPVFDESFKLRGRTSHSAGAVWGKLTVWNAECTLKPGTSPRLVSPGWKKLTQYLLFPKTSKEVSFYVLLFEVVFFYYYF